MKKPKNIPLHYSSEGTPIYRDTTGLPFNNGGGIEPNDKLGKRILKRYPGMQGVYGPKGENLTILKDPNYAAAEHGFGNIEFIFPGSGLVNYSNDYQYQSPTPNNYTAVYNPKGANKHDVFLDMTHGMRDDLDYMTLLGKFAEETKKARGASMDHWYNYDLQNNPYAAGDGRETWDSNFIDGVLRSHLAKKGMGRFSSDVKGYRKERQGSSPEMKEAANEIYKYLKGKPNKLLDGGPLVDKTDHGKLLNSVYASALGNYYAQGGMIKRADGSYSQRGLWDNIRANRGSGKEPTKQMLEQERKINREYRNGGQFPTPYSLPEDSFKQGGDNLHNSVYASSMAQYPAVYKYGGSFDMPRQQMYMPLDNVERYGGSILSMSNTPQLEGEGKDLTYSDGAYVYGSGGVIKNSHLFAPGGPINPINPTTQQSLAQFLNPEFQKIVQGREVTVRPNAYQMQQANRTTNNYDPLLVKNLPSETTQKVAKQSMQAEDLNRVVKNVERSNIIKNQTDPGHLYKTMTDKQISNIISPELNKEAQAAVDRRIYPNLATAQRDLLMGQEANKVRSAQNPLAYYPGYGYKDPRQSGPWNNYNDGAIQSADWVWSLPLGVRALPGTLEGLGTLAAKEIPFLGGTTVGTVADIYGGVEGTQSLVDAIGAARQGNTDKTYTALLNAGLNLGIPLIANAKRTRTVNDLETRLSNFLENYQPEPLSNDVLDLDEIRSAYHNGDRILSMEEFNYLNKHGRGSAADYTTPPSNTFTREQQENAATASRWIHERNLDPSRLQDLVNRDENWRQIFQDYADVTNNRTAIDDYMSGFSNRRPSAYNPSSFSNRVTSSDIGKAAPKPKAIVNKSGLTKEEVLAKAKDKEAVSKMSEEEFQKTVLKPTGEIVSYETSLPSDKMSYDFNSGKMVLKDQANMELDQYANLFNENLDILNDIIAKKNTSGINYQVKELDPRGRLKFYTPAGQGVPEGTATWGVKINPGIWQGEVEDIANAEYLRSIPGIEMSNTLEGVFADAVPRRGTGTYESINEYLKLLGAGRVKPGFNSQTAFSRGLWENAVQKGKAVGFYNDPRVVYGTMKTMLPYVGIGGAAAVGLGNSLPTETSPQKEFKMGGQARVVKSSKLL